MSASTEDLLAALLLRWLIVTRQDVGERIEMGCHLESVPSSVGAYANLRLWSHATLKSVPTLQALAQAEADYHIEVDREAVLKAAEKVAGLWGDDDITSPLLWRLTAEEAKALSALYLANAAYQRALLAATEPWRLAEMREVS